MSIAPPTDQDDATEFPGIASRVFENYQPSTNSYDEVFAANREVRPLWQPLLDKLRTWGLSGIGERSDQARRMLRENGVTYNDVGAPQGPDRPWEVDPLPLLIGQQDWNLLAQGLQQRARLVNDFLADIYGPQHVIRERVIPPGVLYENPAFLHQCRNIVPSGGSHLILHACNLARQTDGTWLVLADRTQGPSGAGYALENRIVISRTLPGVFDSFYVERLASFFKMLQETLRNLAPNHVDNPRAVLLSPGPSSSRYFEDGYLARYLGYALVEGGDLTVRGEEVFLKTLGGLLPVDVILRRVLDGDCDPLELSPDSTFGTAGMLQTVRSGNLAIANALGSSLVEAPLMNAYWPELCRFLLREELQLPCKPTWWCADPATRSHWEGNFEELMFRRAFVHRNAKPILVAELSARDKAELWQQLQVNPAEYVALQRVARATMPTWNGQQLVSGNIVVRSFAVKAGRDYQIMPGGLCRVDFSKHEISDSMSTGQISKDVWVLADRPVEKFSLLPTTTRVMELRRSANDVPSRTADNLFWLGRYAERSEAMVRHLRSCVVRLTNELDPSTAVPELALLTAALQDQHVTGPESIATTSLITLEQIRHRLAICLFDAQSPNSLPYNLHLFFCTALKVRDRLSVDSWRMVSQIEVADALVKLHATPPWGETLLTLNQILNLLAAFGGLGTESMTRGPGWRFLDMGRRIERALQMLHVVRFTLTHETEQLTPLLEAILEIADSSMTYRHRYLASLHLAPLLDLVLIDETNPRAVGFQFNALSEHMLELPGVKGNAQLSPEQRIMLSAQAALRLTDVEALVEVNSMGERQNLERFLHALEDYLVQLSESISHRYLTHTTPPRQLGAVRIGE